MKKYLLASIFVLNFILSFAENYYGKKIGIENGLSQASITSIAYNRDGELWIGTRFGLNEYSNGRIKDFTKKNCGMQGSYINDVFCDSENRLWVCSANGFYLFDKHGGIFKKIANEPMNCVAQHNDTLFVGGHKGILYYNPQSGILEGEESPIWTDILSIYSYSDSLLCIDRKNGIRLLKGYSHTSIDIQEIEGHTLMASCLDSNILYLSVLGKGVFAYDLKSRTPKGYISKNLKETAIVLSLNNIDDNLWLGTDGDGVYVYNPKDDSINKFEHLFSTNPGTEIPKAVTAIFKDPIGNIWLGGERFGLIGLKSSQIRTFLTNTTINCLYISESKGNTYIGTNGEGIWAYSQKCDQKIQLRGTEEMEITTIADFDDEHIILCAYNKGFYTYNCKNGHIEPFIIINKNTNDLECFYGNSPEIYRLQDGRLLIFARHNYIYDVKNHTFTKMEDNPEEYAADLKAVYNTSHKTDSIYTYSQEGIYNIDVKQNKIRRALAYTPELGHINCIAYNDSSFVFGTDYGLYSMNTANYTTDLIPTELFHRVTGLKYAKDRTLWIGADNRLFKYNNGIFSPIGENKGVAANEITQGAIDQGGAIYLSGSNGFLYLKKEDKDTPEEDDDKLIKLQDVNLDGKSVNLLHNSIKIPHNGKDFTVTISLSQSDPLERIVYKYVLEGASSYTTTTFEENFQVPIQKSGTYRLYVSYLKDNDNWSTPQEILTIRKAVPWYLSTVSLITYILLIICALALLIFLLRKKMIEEINESMNKRDLSFMNKFENYLSEHLYENDLNVEQIARQMAMSRASLYIKVKKSYSKGIGEYIEEKRMEEAQKLLKTTSLSVAEIADQIGYSTPRYFSARFKICCGVSPLTYRKRN